MNEPTYGLEEKSNNVDYAILFVMIGVFIVPSFIREFLVSEVLSKVNWLAFLGVVLIVITHISLSRSGKLVIHLKNPALFLTGLVLLLLLAFSELHAGRTLYGFIRVVAGLLAPLIVLFYRPKNKAWMIRSIYFAFSLVSLIIVFFGVINILNANRFILLYYQACGDDTYYDFAIASNRLYSFWGHPLYNAQILLSTIGIAYIYARITGKSKINSKIITAICAVGIVLTASKSAIVIGIVLIFILYIRNMKYMAFIIGSVIVAASFGAFNVVLSRFGGSLSTGRNEIWDSMKLSGIHFFHFFWGNGSDSKYQYEYVISWARAAFEYPFRLFALEFGVLFDIIILTLAFFAPVVELFKGKRTQLTSVVIFLAIIAHVNIYNGIGTYSDQMYTYCLFGLFVLNTNEILNHQVPLLTREKSAQ